MIESTSLLSGSDFIDSVLKDPEAFRRPRPDDLVLTPSTSPDVFISFIQRNRHTIAPVMIVDDASQLVLRALVAPFPWPFFKATKQAQALSSTICFSRVGRDATRLHRTLDILRRYGHVGWLGASGTGKSAAMNEVLGELLFHLGQPGWPEVVVVKLEFTLYEFTLVDGFISRSSMKIPEVHVRRGCLSCVMCMCCFLRFCAS